MKKYIVLLFLGLTGTLHAQFQPIILPVPNVDVYPNRNNWCSAAAAECVLKYKNINKGQCEIMNWIRTQPNSGYGGYPCCDPIPGWPSNEHPCDKGVPFGYYNEKVSVKKILMHYSNNTLASEALTYPLNTYNIKEALDQDRPIFAHWFYDTYESNAHAVVIRGIHISQNLVYYMDPDPDLYNGGYQFLPYNTFHIDGSRRWEGTLRLIDCSSRGYPCHCYNGEQDGDETGIDCGGACPPCGTPPPPPPPPAVHCSDCRGGQW